MTKERLCSNYSFATNQNKKDKMNIDSRVNQILIERKLTQTQVAKEIGVNRSTVSATINGLIASRPTRYKVAKYLGVAVENLWPSELEGQCADRDSSFRAE